MATSNCADCVYKGMAGELPHCAYIFKTGQRRPCPPGDECTVKVPYRKRIYPKRKKKDSVCE